MHPQQILHMIEETAGLLFYRDQKSKANNEISKKQEKVNQILFTLQEEVSAKIGVMERAREEIEMYKSAIEKIKAKERQVKVLEYRRDVSEIDLKRIVFQKLKSENDRNQQRISEKENAYEISKNILKGLQLNMEQFQSNKSDSQLGLDRLENVLWSSENETSHLKKEIVTNDYVLKNLQRKLNKLKLKKLPKLQEECCELSLKVETLKNDLWQKKKQLKYVETCDVEVWKQQIQNQLETEETENKLIKRKIKNIVSLLTDTERDEFQQKQEKLIRNSKRAEYQNEILVLNEELASVKFNEYQIKAAAKQLNDCESNLYAIYQQLSDERFWRVNIIIKRYPFKEQNHQTGETLVYGKLFELFSIKDPTKFSTPLEIGAGYKLQQVVVKNQDVVKKIFASGRLNYSTTFMPIQNMSNSFTISHHTLSTIEQMTRGKAWLAKSLIEYDPILEPVMNHVFGNFFIAKDRETAKKIAMGNNLQRFLCVTLDGDKYAPSGTLEGGYQNFSANLLSSYAKLRELQSNQSELTRL
ncbi:hypothetical protein FGO68_gene8926 [Halteria grandinella]|uniref:SMC hinge domain-containing protein n=1 Tax=Halteria grandinella TaxID=5974 RepID=A0A8J8P423_HALGN|nr:hypothetical protein FGO68_gene8926 [Halteria grandinella]